MADLIAFRPLKFSRAGVGFSIVPFCCARWKMPVSCFLLLLTFFSFFVGGDDFLNEDAFNVRSSGLKKWGLGFPPYLGTISQVTNECPKMTLMNGN